MSVTYWVTLVFEGKGRRAEAASWRPRAAGRKVSITASGAWAGWGLSVAASAGTRFCGRGFFER